MFDQKRSKSTILALAFLALLTPASWSQEKVDTVHVSQPKTQDLGESATGKGKGSNGSLGGFGGLGYSGGAFNNSSSNKNNRNNRQNDSGNGTGVNIGNPNGTTGTDTDTDTPTTNNPPTTGTPPFGNPPGSRPPGSRPPGGGKPPFGNPPTGTPDPFNPTTNEPPFTGPPGTGNVPPHGPGGPGLPIPPGGGGGGGTGAEGGGSGMASPQSNQDEAAKEFCAGVGSLDESWQGGCIRHQNNGNGPEVTNQVNQSMIAGHTWPFTTPPFQASMSPFAGSQNGQSIWKQLPQSIKSGSTPPSAAEVATIRTITQNAAVESLFQPNSWLQTAKEVQNTQTQANADNSANMEKQQASCAIDFVRSYLENFTVNSGNQWNRLRNELFMPMAVLLLLPGAIATQAKATVAQGFPIFGEVSPVEGIYRSIVAIFLIPGTYLIVNYGIDVSNAISQTISSQYQQIFGSDMYRDAMCAHIRAFPSRLPSENLGHIPKDAGQMQGQGSGPRAKFEGANVDVKLEDPCAGIYEAPENKANEKVAYAVNAQRASYNGMGAALAMTWNILCAFQMVYLYYLWFVGPIMAALWVWPVKQLRDAFPNWCEGVITICFWSLFWNTTVLLMACFRGIDDTGTVIMEALNFLSTACVKFAFDFAGLVKAAGAEAGKMAEKGAGGGGGGGKGGGTKGGGNKGGGHPGGPGPGHSDPGKGPDKHASPPAQTQLSNLSFNNTSSPTHSDSGGHKQNLHAMSPQGQQNAPPTSDAGSTPPGSVDAKGSFGPISVDAPPPPQIDAGYVDVQGLAGLPGVAGVDSANASFANPGGAADAAKQMLNQNSEQQQAANQMARDQAMQTAQQAQEQLKAQALSEATTQQKQQQDGMQKLAGDALAQALISQTGQGKDSPVTAPPPDSPAAAKGSAIDQGQIIANAMSSPGVGGGLPPGSGAAGSLQDPQSIIRQGADAAGLQANNIQQQLGGGNPLDPSSGGQRPGQADPSGGLTNTNAQANFSTPLPTDGGFNAPPTQQGFGGYNAMAAGNFDINSASAVPGPTPQDPKIIDIPGDTSKVQVDLPGGGGGVESLPKTAAPTDEGAYYSVQSGGAFAASYEGQTQDGAPGMNLSAPQVNERGSVDSNAAQHAAEIPMMLPSQSAGVPPQNAPSEQQVLYRQGQDQVIEERKAGPANTNAADQQKRNMENQKKFVDQQKLNQMRSALPPSKPQILGKPGAKAQPGQQQQGQTPEQKPDEQAGQTPHKSETPLADQVKYGTILRRSRDTSSMSEEEEELMRKLASGQPPEQAEQPEQKPEDEQS